jgi:23S rRNA pseudouridine1911/1915/1917 synthase
MEPPPTRKPGMTILFAAKERLGMHNSFERLFEDNQRRLFEDNHCLAVNKPAGLLTQGDRSGEPSLVDLIRDDLKARYHKPGNVYVGLLHRLDRPTSGVVLVAKTSKAASRLSADFRSGRISKLYWAIVEGVVADPAGRWVDRLVKDRRANRVAVADDAHQRGQVAEVDFEVLDRRGRFTKLALKPATGRSHQLRAQLASRGLPILGDRKYGSTKSVKAQDGGFRIALHARQLTFTHPTLKEVISVEAAAPADWPELCPPWSERRFGSRKPAAGSSP